MIKRKVYQCCYCDEVWFGNLRKLKLGFPQICPRCKHRFTDTYRPIIVQEVAYGLSSDEQSSLIKQIQDKLGDTN